MHGCCANKPSNQDHIWRRKNSHIPWRQNVEFICRYLNFPSKKPSWFSQWLPAESGVGCGGGRQVVVRPNYKTFWNKTFLVELHSSTCNVPPYGSYARVVLSHCECFGSYVRHTVLWQSSHPIQVPYRVLTLYSTVHVFHIQNASTFVQCTVQHSKHSTFSIFDTNIIIKVVQQERIVKIVHATCTYMPSCTVCTQKILAL